MSLDTIRLSQPAKDQLVKLKRVTGIKNWNVLCRWALVVSLQDGTPPLVRNVVADSNIEMSWRTFAGFYGDIYMALIRSRCLRDGSEPTEEACERILIMHMHRGIGYLAGRRDLNSVDDLIRVAFA
ncbi:DNA sulfur modification protein DndE [Nonomuraea glycinis]|uniref:DNA sulfur modification protein DndE n=1 Tax=Nonomuraea glycinis TaxID=2047744 RepID=UPI002E10C03F|nr:DNA sulfur modification protein DndE [Nonomuraea glycinis]